MIKYKVKIQGFNTWSAGVPNPPIPSPSTTTTMVPPPYSNSEYEVYAVVDLEVIAFSVNEALNKVKQQLSRNNWRIKEVIQIDE